MKPTPEISSNRRHSSRHDRTRGDHRSFPSTEYSFQSTAQETGVSAATAEEKIVETRPFRALSREYGSEATREYIIEAISFACISAVAAWPMTVLLHELLGMMIG